ncbi:MAG TPA: hypothetical protein EYP55_07900 [Anaerolineae bacterium]|nr:hypothetical protein [Anaerolineae bacterium]
MARKRGKEASFLVRIWQEPGEKEGQAPQWRGTIEDLLGEETHDFHDQQAMFEFIQEMINKWIREAGQEEEPNRSSA